MASKLESQIINYLATQPGVIIELAGEGSFTDYSIHQTDLVELFERLGYSRFDVFEALNNLEGRETLISSNGRLSLSWEFQEVR